MGIVQWHREPAVWVCVLAILCSLIDRYLIRRLLPRSIPDETIVTPRLFVAITSFCDRSWGSMVQELLNSAYEPRQLRIGVLEYIRSVDDTLEPAIPTEWRESVHVYSASHKTATTLRRAQQLCVQQLYTGECFALLFGTAASPVKDWDRKLLHDACADRVVSMHISANGTPTFPCLRAHGEVCRKPILAVDSSTFATPSLLVENDAVLVSKDAIETALSSTNTLTVTAQLVAAHKTVVTPTQRLFTRARHPVTVSRGRSSGWVKSQNAAYAILCGIREDSDLPSVNARIGLTTNPTSAEKIAKFGSVLGARLAVQEEENPNEVDVS